MKARERKILIINLLQNQGIQESSLTVDGIHFSIREHQIGWDFETAEMLIQTHDGYVDGFAMSGLPKHLRVGKKAINHPGYLRLLRAATKTPFYVADDIRDFFADWTIKKVLKEQPQLFFGKKVLFLAATATAVLEPIHQAGGKVLASDPLLYFKAPVLLRGMRQVEHFFKLIKPVARTMAFRKMNPALEGSSAKIMQDWLQECDIFVGFGNILAGMRSFENLEGKIVIADHLDSGTRSRLEQAGVSQIIEFIPTHSAVRLDEIKHFALLAAIIDQTRISEDSPLSLDEFLLEWFQRNRVSPNGLKSSRGIRRRCAFVIHALSQDDLWRVPALKHFRDSPPWVRKGIETVLAKLPPLYMGSLRGVVSQANGQEVDCDFYALTATPRGILAMDEERLYNRLVQCAEMAKKRGAGILGLGAYTKVAGDAGVTVAKRSPIPVTNGNSYSASTTLWAARAMVEKLGLISTERIGKRLKAKAMVIGATGSIGRVSSLLVSLVFQELVLVANRADKLLELREEVLALSPGIDVKITTRSDSEIADADLIVTATSNQSGTVLDIEKVKPGAVICDCSRPLDITQEEAAKRPDVLVIESGEVLLPGNLSINVDIGLPPPSVYACTAETVILALEGRYESFSLSKQLSLEKVKEIYKLGEKHGARLSAIQGPEGLITEERIRECRRLALEKRAQPASPGLKHEIRTENTPPVTEAMPS